MKTRGDILQKGLYFASDMKKIKDDPFLVKRENLDRLKKIYPDKYFGAIHVDAIGAAVESLNEGFDTIEINVRASDLRIGHAPQKVYSIDLDEYLSKIPLDKVKMIWLDMKELQESDIDNVIQRLNELDKKYNLKSRTLIENTLISPQMKKFVENGWKASYYIFLKLSPEDINRGFDYNLNEIIKKVKPDQDEEKKLRLLAERIAKDIKLQKSTDLSFYAYLYPFVKKYLEPLLAKNIRYNTFAIENIPSIDDIDMIKKMQNITMLKDERIQIILIDPLTRFSIRI
jgi:hypothetical protein